MDGFVTPKVHLVSRKISDKLLLFFRLESGSLPKTVHIPITPGIF